MVNDIELEQGNMNRELNVAIENATSIITKSYLNKLEKYKIIKPSREVVDTDISKCGKFYKLSKLILNKEENFLDKLTTIVNVAYSIGSSLATIMKSDGNNIDYYIGTISKNCKGPGECNEKKRKAVAQAFKGAINGNLIGSDIEEVLTEKVVELQNTIFGEEAKAISAISGMVSLRDRNNKSIEGYVQGIENLVDSLKGQKYTIMLIADPIHNSDIQVIKQGYELIHTQLSSFLKSTITFNENDTTSLSRANTEGITSGITNGIAMTQSKTHSKGNFASSNIGGGINIGIVSANFGKANGTNSNDANTQGSTKSKSEINMEAKSKTQTSSKSETSGKSLQLNYENRSIKSLLDKIDKHLERLDICESFGAFDCAAYVISSSRENALTVASNYNALMRGEESSIQTSHINSWNAEEEMSTLKQYLKSCTHPRFCKEEENEKKIIMSPASVVNGKEIAIQIGLPKKSIQGITVVPMAPFGRNTINVDEGQSLAVGDLYHMGNSNNEIVSAQKVEIDIESLSMHTFITGSTGTGKSNTIYSILDKLMVHPVKDEYSKEMIKFLVIEPIKGEYKDRFGNYDNVSVYGTNDKKTPLLRINPFSFPEDIHILEHIDKLIEIFNVCWPMYAAMPAVLKESIERAYNIAGWNLNTSECGYVNEVGDKLYPTFFDILNQINLVMEESQYSDESKGNYKGALCTRIKSLTNGLYGKIFTNNELSLEELFDENVIVDLSRIGSGETKALIMGLLVMKLQEYRMASAKGGNSTLKHVTVIEEAHNLLKRTSTEQNSEMGNVLGKSVEMLSNSIAEMRTYGEGFIIADQAPGLMDKSVIRNTNTKIILRLPDYEDRELVGKAASLNEEQILELSRLKNFVAAVYQNNWLEPVLCDVDVNFMKNINYINSNLSKESILSKENYIEYLLVPIEKRKQLDSKYIERLENEIFKLSISADSKVAFIKYMKAKTKSEIRSLRCKVMFGMFNSEIAFGLSKNKENNVELWCESMCEILEPNISRFKVLDQRKIIETLLIEEILQKKNKNLQEIFEKIM